MARNVDTDWNETNVARLRALWAEGGSAAKIGAAMGLTKSTVIGKARRLKLPARPSPIIRSGGMGEPRKPRRVGAGATLPPLGGAAEWAGAAPAAARRRNEMIVPPAITPMPESVKAFMVLRVPQMCSYPIGEVKSRDFRYCDAPAVMGKVYCPEHCAVCFVTPAEIPALRRWERERA